MLMKVPAAEFSSTVLVSSVMSVGRSLTLVTSMPNCSSRTAPY